jgi:hypothetical protein
VSDLIKQKKVERVSILEYLIGIIMVSCKSIVSVFSKKYVQEISIKTHLLIFSVLNLVYALIFFNNISGLTYKLFYKTSIFILLFLLVHFTLRIVTNISQMTIFSRKDIDLNIISAFMSTSSGLSLLSYFIIQRDFKLYTMLAFLFANIGAIIMTIDRSNGKYKFYFNKSIIPAVIINYFSSGFKLIMINTLLRYFTPSEMAVLDIINYFLIFGIMYRNQIKDIIKSPFKYRLYPIMVLLNVIAIFLEVRLTVNIELICVIEFLTPVLTIILSSLLLKSRLTKRQILGIIICSIGITTTKVM